LRIADLGFPIWNFEFEIRNRFTSEILLSGTHFPELTTALHQVISGIFAPPKP
jgi:hypothetical protein